MLFISRYIRSDGVQDSYGNTLPEYGVVDTDDGSETVVCWPDLTDVTCRLGVKIAGVETEVIGDDKYMKSVKPTQPRDTITKLQSKTAALSRVRVLTWKDWVTLIQFDASVCKAPPEIRLSDFGSRVADFVLCDLSYMRRHSVTLILDDKINFSSSSFSVEAPKYAGFETLGVVYDLRELSDGPANMLYRNLFTSMPRNADLSKSFMDKPERFHKMMLLFYGRGNGCCL